MRWQLEQLLKAGECSTLYCAFQPPNRVSEAKELQQEEGGGALRRGREARQGLSCQHRALNLSEESCNGWVGPMALPSSAMVRIASACLLGLVTSFFAAPSISPSIAAGQATSSASRPNAGQLPGPSEPLVASPQP